MKPELRGIALMVCAALAAGCESIGDGVGPVSMEISIGGETESAEAFECLAVAPQLLVTFTNGAIGDHFSRATWFSSDESVLRVSDGTVGATGGSFFNGVLLPVSAGTATLRAEYIGFSDEIEVTVSPAQIEVAPFDPVLVPNSTRNLTATAVVQGREAFSASSVLGQGDWSIAAADGGEALSSISSTGVVTSPESGAGTDVATFRIDFCDREAQTNVVVRDEQLQSLVVARASDPATPISTIELPPATSEALSVTGVFSGGLTQDLTPLVTYDFAADDLALANTFGFGVVTLRSEAVAGQQDTLTVSFDPDSEVAGDEIIAPPITVRQLDLSLDPASLTLSPQQPLMLPGSDLQFSAAGTFNGPDGSVTRDLTLDVSWATSDLFRVSIDAFGAGSGLASASDNRLGSATISYVRSPDALDDVQFTEVINGGEVDDDDILQNPVILTDLRIAEQAPTLRFGERLELTAIATLSNGERTFEQDLTGAVVWVSSDETVARVANAAALRGRVAAVTELSDQLVTIEARFRDTAIQPDTFVAGVEVLVNPSDP